MYDWRRMTPDEREQTMRERIRRGGTRRRAPLIESGFNRYMITAACFEHAPHIGKSVSRMLQFEGALLTQVQPLIKRLHAHVILPNHYHILLEATAIKPLREALGKLHGATAFQWNRQEGCRGRKVFHGSAETVIKSERHFWASLNYIHNNPVRHGYVKRWQDWPYSSAQLFLKQIGRKKAREIWKHYPVDQMGNGWDDH